MKQPRGNNLGNKLVIGRIPQYQHSPLLKDAADIGALGCYAAVFGSMAGTLLPDVLQNRTGREKNEEGEEEETHFKL